MNKMYLHTLAVPRPPTKAHTPPHTHTKSINLMRLRLDDESVPTLSNLLQFVLLYKACFGYL